VIRPVPDLVIFGEHDLGHAIVEQVRGRTDDELQRLRGLMEKLGGATASWSRRTRHSLPPNRYNAI
jgi:hypothetical protein